ncbi:MAG: hypothetical protein KF764_34515 [Labilithrix sp.]|nr:hypothetical protein [Labilithrix sp.]
MGTGSTRSSSMSSPKEKPTVDLNLEEIQRALLERLESKMDSVITDQRTNSAELRSVSAEVRSVSAEVRSVAQTTENTRVEVQRLNGRVTELEGDVRDLRDDGAGIRRQHSETDLERQAAIGGAVAHVSKLEATVQALREDMGGLVRSQTAQTVTLGNLNTLLVTLSDAISKNAKFVKYGMVVGGIVIGAVVAAVKAL